MESIYWMLHWSTRQQIKNYVWNHGLDIATAFAMLFLVVTILQAWMHSELRYVDKCLAGDASACKMLEQE